MLCPNCKTQNRESAKFCIHCGAGISDIPTKSVKKKSKLFRDLIFGFALILSGSLFYFFQPDIKTVVKEPIMKVKLRSKGFHKNENGIYYRFYEKGEGVKPEPGKFVSMDLVCRDSRDSVFLDSRKSGVPFILNFIQPEYRGDIYEAIGMMSVGDSASFIIGAERFFTTTALLPILPESVEPGSYINFDIKLLNVMTEEEQRFFALLQMKPDDYHDYFFALGDDLLMNETLNELKVGSRVNEVIRLLGEPSEKTETIFNEGPEAYYRSFFYPEKGIELLLEGEKDDNQAVVEITINSPCKFRTSKGIKIGDNYKTVKQAYIDYYNPVASSDEELVAGHSTGGLRFRFKDKQVESIWLGFYWH